MNNTPQTKLTRFMPRLLVVLLGTALLLTSLITVLTKPNTTQAQITDEQTSLTTAVTTETVLLHYWLFDDDLPNNTPLTTITATYGIVTGTEGYIEYHSALDGYPFEDGHPNWREASMERRNRPTEINYRPEGNNDIPYDDAGMRGLQIRQPFTGDGGENTVIFHLPTTGYQDVVFQFAAKDEGAADSLIMAYSTSANEPDWTTADLISHTLPLTQEYQLYTIDFSHIETANNNPDFKIRIQFDGPDMGADDGDRVTFNNFSLDGAPLPDTNLPPVVELPIPLQQLVAEGDAVTIDLDDVFTDPDNDPLTFTVESEDTAVIHLTITNSILTLTGLSQGEAAITVYADDGFNEPVANQFRALVYPAAHPLSEGLFTFTGWDPNTPERVYPNHMLFLQSDQDDPGLEADLLYAYYIPHDDYHANDQDTIGFPYNNTGRTRLNGLGGDGISFINTGRGRDLGGALVALDTRGVDEIAIDWLAGTILENLQVYALRLQYRLGIDDPFTDLLVDGQPVEYLTGPDGDLQTFSQIPLPDEALEQPYVQLLWRYYRVDVGSGSRAMLRLDNLVVGTPGETPNLPPVVEWPIPLQELVAEGGAVTINLDDVFTDPDDDPLTFTVESEDTAVIHLTITNSILTLTGLSQGEAAITVYADDGFNEPVANQFRALVYPAAHPLSDSPFTFTEWYSGTAERVYPDHMLFLQSDQDDPGLEADLLYAYYIPHNDYHANDQDTIGFPYNNTGRTRLNGLGEDGISFINTGRGRDLGGALVALDTRGVEAVAIDWLAGTIRQNFRVYALRLQYRLDIDDPFTDLLVGGEPVEYLTGPEGEVQTFSKILLPAEALDQPYVQLLWRYYHVEVDSGPRAMLRLDDIVVGPPLPDYVIYLPYIAQTD